jgi:hypothetical protein
VDAKIDLYDIYRKVKQRAVRCSYSSQKEAATKALNAMEIVIDSPSVENAGLFKEIEKEWINHPYTRSGVVQYGDIVLVAIKSNAFEVSRPFYNTKALGFDPVFGTFYVAESELKKNQIKIGCTTRDIDERLRKFKQKYGYELNLKLYVSVSYPSRVEEYISKQIREGRVTGCSDGDSNEWYFGSASDVRVLVESFCKINGYKIYKIISY